MSDSNEKDPIDLFEEIRGSEVVAALRLPEDKVLEIVNLLRGLLSDFYSDIMLRESYNQKKQKKRIEKLQKLAKQTAVQLSDMLINPALCKTVIAQYNQMEQIDPQTFDIWYEPKRGPGKKSRGAILHRYDLRHPAPDAGPQALLEVKNRLETLVKALGEIGTKPSPFKTNKPTQAAFRELSCSLARVLDRHIDTSIVDNRQEYIVDYIQDLLELIGVERDQKTIKKWLSTD